MVGKLLPSILLIPCTSKQMAKLRKLRPIYSFKVTCKQVYIKAKRCLISKDHVTRGNHIRALIHVHGWPVMDAGAVIAMMTSSNLEVKKWTIDTAFLCTKYRSQAFRHCLKLVKLTTSL